MRGGFVSWVVMFFTRPVRLSDIAAVVRGLREKRSRLAAAATLASPIESRSRIRPEPSVARDRWVETDPAVDVSEQPLDTLPAELRDEFHQLRKP